ncbi:hypothetical protein [Dictyobacter vulcani]|nr:hypothetical protein [Dictyobacter vulcani]
MSVQPEFLTLGHVARDVQADGSFVLGAPLLLPPSPPIISD